MAGRGQGPVLIALLTDPHTTRGTKDDQALYRGRFDEVIRQVNRARVNLVLIAGDLTQGGQADEIADFKAEAARFQAPTFWVPGNHDVGNKRLPGSAEVGVTAEKVAAYEAALGPSFYAQTVAGIRVIGLNSSLFGSGLLREQQMEEFLVAQIAQPSPLRTVVFMHYPPFLKSADEKGGTYWNIEPAPRQRLLATLQRGGVNILLTGHLHYQLINHYNGMLIVTSAPVSFGIPRKEHAPEGWNLVTVPVKGEPSVEFNRVAE